MFVKPCKDRQVPDPARNDLLPAEGREVEPSQYWQRRLADGDVEVAQAPAPSEAAAPAAPAKKAKE